jgi:hypothetical protein
MFSNDPRDLCATLTQMQRTALERANFNQIDAKEKFREFLAHDTRFGEFDTDRLINRVSECRSNGAVLDLDDPYLQKNGEKRPLSR